MVWFFFFELNIQATSRTWQQQDNQYHLLYKADCSSVQTCLKLVCKAFDFELFGKSIWWASNTTSMHSFLYQLQNLDCQHHLTLIPIKSKLKSSSCKAWNHSVKTFIVQSVQLDYSLKRWLREIRFWKIIGGFGSFVWLFIFCLTAKQNAISFPLLCNNQTQKQWQPLWKNTWTRIIFFPAFESTCTYQIFFFSEHQTTMDITDLFYVLRTKTF